MAERNIKWACLYERAINDDGSLLFPERLSMDFLEEARRGMGTMLFANQYLNEVIPLEDARFKEEWFKTWSHLPEGNTYTFAMIDPAISTQDGADYTGTAVVTVDHNTNWYIRHASRKRLTPTEIVNWCFDLHREFNLTGLGLEDVAYQKALLYMLSDEMRRRQVILPAKGVNKGNKTSKEKHILSLVPYFEFGRMFLTTGCDDLKRELLQYPRSRYDDISDALALIQQIVFYPVKPKETLDNVTSPHDPRFESKVIRDLARKANEQI